jgi:hypothetical protein
MHPSSGSIQLLAERRFLRVVLAVVLLAAGLSGVLATVSAPLGLLALLFALAAGPVALVVDDRTRTARRVGTAPGAGAPRETSAAAG